MVDWMLLHTCATPVAVLTSLFRHWFISQYLHVDMPWFELDIGSVPYWCRSFEKPNLGSRVLKPSVSRWLFFFRWECARAGGLRTGEGPRSPGSVLNQHTTPRHTVCLTHGWAAAVSCCRMPLRCLASPPLILSRLTLKVKAAVLPLCTKPLYLHAQSPA